MQQEKVNTKIVVLDTKYEPKLAHDAERQTMKEYFDHYDYNLLKFQASNPKVDQTIIGSSEQNGFVTAFRVAYEYHMPLELKPDTIWLTVCQGFAQHILLNSEELRKQFVDFDGKKTLRVNCDAFEFGSPNNDWPQFFSQISDKIKDILGKKAHEMFVHSFTTTTPLDKTVYEGTLLSAMQKYFCYVCCTACAIPKVRFLGTPDDWKKLREKVSQISKFNLDWWISKLLPIIDKIIAAAVDGEKDSDFWNSVYKLACPDESGAVLRINGWMGNFFPYLDSQKNDKLRDLDQVLKIMKQFDHQYLIFDEYSCEYDQGDQPDLPKLSPEELQIRKQKISRAYELYDTFADAERVPSGLTKAPFKWEIDGQQKDMKLMSGFFGAELTQDGFIRPKVGWAIAEQLEQPEPNEQEEEVQNDDEDEENQNQVE